jgi:hypothetical protein
VRRRNHGGLYDPTTYSAGRAERANDPPVMLVLDAKSVSHFREERFWDVSDYRSRVCDPETGHQPVRQVFLLTGMPVARL